MSKKFSYEDVSKHTTKKDLFVVIHGKVYNVSDFVDEHPGGEEVLLDVGGQDASDAFEDVGHSDEAREILSDKLLVGELVRKPGDPVPNTTGSSAEAYVPSETGGLGVGLYAILLVGVAGAYFAYQYLQANQDKS